MSWDLTPVSSLWMMMFGTEILGQRDALQNPVPGEHPQPRSLGRRDG